MRSSLAALAAALVTSAADAQPPDPATVVEGVVFDSLLTMRPLADAEVWVEGTATTARTDAAGRFVLRGLEPGRRRLAVSHPSLDALGVTGPVAELTVRPGATATLALATPAAATAYARLCGAPPAPGTAVVAGVVEGGDGTVVWARGAGPGPAPRTRTDAEGRFRLCGLAAQTLTLFAADTLADGRARLAAVPVATGGRPIVVATVRLPAVVAAPAGTLPGRVLTPGGLPIRDATVEVAGARPARSDAAGRFSLQLPAGPPDAAYQLAVRAVGFQAEALRVDRTTGGVSIALAPVAPELERVLTRATASLDLTGFEARRASGNGGRFITADEIRAQSPARVSQVLKRVPGLVVSRDTRSAYLPENHVSSHRTQGSSPLRPEGCEVSVYVDGALIPGLMKDLMGPGGIDAALMPGEILGIEVYLGFANVPPRFQRTATGCGTVLIWTKREPPR